MKTIFKVHDYQWSNIWAGQWSLLTCSHFGKQYTQILKIESKPFVRKAVFLIHQGKSAGYLDTKEKDDFGKHIAALYSQNPKKISALCKRAKKEVDSIIAFIQKYEQKEITKEIYSQFWTHVDKYYVPHITVKYIVDYLQPSVLAKYLPHLQEVRVYAEPVFKRTEEFMMVMASKIATKTNYKPEHLLCLLSEEIDAYFKSQKLPPKEVLEERYLSAVLLFKEGRCQAVVGKEVEVIEKNLAKPVEKAFLQGTTAFPGKVTGIVRIVHDPRNIKDFKAGDILVTGMTRPEYLPLIQKAAAIITDAGGILSHAAITARELQKPCVIGTQAATKILREGDFVEVNATEGKIKKLKTISKPQEWHAVASELESENLKLASYDTTLIPMLGELNGKKILDYGCGPGVLALALQKMGADVKVYDISPDMLKKAGEKIGTKNIYSDLKKVPKGYFDVVICNLVLCIVPEEEVKMIVENVKRVLTSKGIAYFGFCNPLIFNIPESRLDFRYSSEHRYEENHAYRKTKKEGGYEIIELHRPVEWYERVYRKAGLKLIKMIFTPEYMLKGNKIRDFVIFKLINPKTI